MTTEREDVRSELEGVSKALGEIGQRAATDPEFRAELGRNQVELMRAAGLSVMALARVARENDVSEEELEAYDLGLAALGDDGTSELTVSNWCVGTCKKQTIWVCGGCSNSFLAAG